MDSCCKPIDILSPNIYSIIQFFNYKHSMHFKRKINKEMCILALRDNVTLHNFCLYVFQLAYSIFFYQVLLYYIQDPSNSNGCVSYIKYKQGIAQSVGNWFFNRVGVQAIGCPYPCDKTCHNLVFN